MTRVRIVPGPSLSSGTGTWVVQLDGVTVYQHTRYPVVKSAKRAAESLVESGDPVTPELIAWELRQHREVRE